MVKKIGGQLIYVFWTIFSSHVHCLLLKIERVYKMFFCLLQDDLNRKIRRAFCPPKVATCNPCFDYIKYIIFPWFGKLEVIQKEGNADYK
jgi:hypothetical protein